MVNFCTKCGTQLQNGNPCPNCNNATTGNVVQSNMNANTQSNINQVNNQNMVYNQTQINQNNINTNQNSNQNQKPKKKKRGCLISIIVFLVIIVGLIILVYNLAKPKKYEEQIAIAKDYQYFAISDENEYKISNAEEDIYFHVTSDAEYKIIDENGNEVLTELQGNKIVNPSKYEKGKQYTITLSEGSFLSSQLENTKKVIFKIKRDEIKKYKYSSKVVKANLNDLKFSNNNSFTSNTTYKVGDIIIIGEKDDISTALCVTSVNGNTYETREAKIDEIYSELDYYYEAPVDLTDVTISKQLEEYVINDVKNSPWYAAIVEEVHAAPKTTIDVVPLDDGSVELTIKIKISPNEKSIIINPKNHSLELTFKQTIKMSSIIDITLTNWDVLFDITVGQSYDFQLKNKVLDYKDAEAKDATKELIKKIKEAIEKNQHTDSASSESDLAKIVIPLGIPGLSATLDIELISTITISADFGLSGGHTTNVVVGFDYGQGEEFEFIGSYDKEYRETKVSFAGKVEEKVGVKVSVGIDIIGIINANLNATTGLYASATTKIGYTLGDENSFDVSLKIENGLFLDLAVEADLTITKYSHTFVNLKLKLVEKEWTFNKKYNEDGTLVGSESDNTSTDNNETSGAYGTEIQSEEERLQRYSCVDSTEDDSYVKYTYNFENGKFKNIEMKGVYYINTGIDVVDQFLELIIQIIAVCLKVYYNFGTTYYVEGNYHYIVVPLDEKDIQKELGDINIDDYYSFKESMTNNEYICK